MPRVIKPKVAIDKVLGAFLRANGFNLKMATPNEIYDYSRTKDNFIQVISIHFKWIPDLIIQDGYKIKEQNPQYYEEIYWKYQHRFIIYIRGYKKGGNLAGFIMRKNYPHITPRPGEKMTQEQLHEGFAVKRRDPLLNWHFLNQHELEERLSYIPRALEEYGLPYM